MELQVAVVDKKRQDKDPVTAEMGVRVRLAREAIGLSQKDLADRVGVTQQSVQEFETGRTKTTKHLHRYARELGQSVDWIEFGEGDMREAGAIVEVVPARTPPDVPALAALPKDVPIVGVTYGGAEDNSFSLNMGEIVDYARRLPAIARSKGVFALYVQGESMAKWRQPGGLVYLDPARPARPGDHVVVEFHPDEMGNGVTALLKLLVGTTPTRVKLRQYNPERLIEVPLSKIRKIHRVMEWEELIV